MCFFCGFLQQNVEDRLGHVAEFFLSSRVAFLAALTQWFFFPKFWDSLRWGL